MFIQSFQNAHSFLSRHTSFRHLQSYMDPNQVQRLKEVKVVFQLILQVSPSYQSCSEYRGLCRPKTASYAFKSIGQCL